MFATSKRLVLPFCVIVTSKSLYADLTKLTKALSPVVISDGEYSRALIHPWMFVSDAVCCRLTEWCEKSHLSSLNKWQDMHLLLCTAWLYKQPATGWIVSWPCCYCHILWREEPLWKQVISVVANVFYLLLILNTWAWITKYNSITYDHTRLQSLHRSYCKKTGCYHGNHVWQVWEINCSSISPIIISIIRVGCLYYHVNRRTCQVTGTSWKAGE